MPRNTLPIQLDIHRSSLSACRRCDTVHPSVVPILSLARNPKVLLVGQAPGKTETVDQRPFAGRAGRTLFQWLARAGLDEERARKYIYIAAVTRCYPGPSPSGRGDRVPSPVERERCGHWLEQELKLIRPRLIIPVGGLAISRFFGSVPLDRVVGRKHTVQHIGGTSTVIPLPHPSGASSWIHVGNHVKLLDQALDLLRRELHGLVG